MKKLGLLAILMALTSFAHAHYDGLELRGWVKEGTTVGKTVSGEACSVTGHWFSDHLNLVEVKVGTDSIIFNKLIGFNVIDRFELPSILDVVVQFDAREANPNPTTRQGIVLSPHWETNGTYVQVFENEQDVNNVDYNRVLHCIIPLN